MKWLRQSTQVAVPFGPFVDPADAVTWKTSLASALDHLISGIRLSKNGAAFAVRNPGSVGSPSTVTGASVYGEHGHYLVTLDAVDTASLGTLRMSYAEPGGSPSPQCLPVWDDFMVLPANAYDALVNGTDALQVDAVELNSDAGAAVRAAALSRSTVFGTVRSGSSTISVLVNTLSVSPGLADQFKGLILKFRDDTATASLRGQATDITASTVGGSPDVVTLTVTALTTAPAAGDIFTIS